MNFRERLEFMGKAPAMCAITREGFLLHVMALLDVLGIDSHPMMRFSRPAGELGNVVSMEHMKTEIVVSDPWPLEVVQAALSMLPEGSGEFVFTQVGDP